MTNERHAFVEVFLSGRRSAAGLLFLALMAPAYQAATCAGVEITGLKTIVYVSPTGEDHGSCGASPEGACQTIQQGINNCKSDGCSVLVRHGTYTPSKAVSLANGVNVYGSCVSTGPDHKERSIIEGRPAVSADGINKPTTFFGFTVRGLDAQVKGAASIAMTVSNTNALTFSHNTIESGRGGDGRDGDYADGGRGGDGGGASGNSGGGGGRACPANPPSDGSGTGGAGADFQHLYAHDCFLWCGCETTNPNESLGKQGKKSGSVAGGDGGSRGNSGCSCGPPNGTPQDGPNGYGGNMGACSTTGGVPSKNITGTFDGTTWQPSYGGAGADGNVGSGGGGGGSGGYGVQFYCLGTSCVVPFNGRPGGGGGGGGCGGNGGAGGQQGGASIPLVLFKSTVLGLAGPNVLIPGPGGKGGNAAQGGKGGIGGNGVNGQGGHYANVKIVAECDVQVPGSGGKGGNGGQGGAGSGGAGGNGGPSFGVALVSSPYSFGGSLRIYDAAPGAGGQANQGGQNGSQQCAGARGTDGTAGFSDNNNSVVSYP